jgi:hypothetical protein
MKNENLNIATGRKRDIGEIFMRDWRHWKPWLMKTSMSG